MPKQSLSKLDLQIMRFFLRNRFNRYSGVRIAKALKSRTSSIYASLNKLCELKYMIHDTNKYLLSENFGNYNLDNLFLSTLYGLYKSVNEEYKYDVFDFSNFLQIYANEIKIEINK